jgi:photosystem II stability/assembly factor-like uncharacterized protein
MYAGTFVDDKNGWFIECFPGRIWHTADGGGYWTKQKDSTAVWAYDIVFLNNQKGFVAGKNIPDYKGFIWKTQNSGNTWEEIAPAPLMLKLFFIDSLVGFAAGDNEILKTINGGTSWHKTSIDSGVFFTIWNIYFPDKRHGWAVGSNGIVIDIGIILNTVDGGETWQVNLEEATATGLGLSFTDSLHGVVVGANPPFFSGTIMRTENGGKDWDAQYLPCSWLKDVVFTNDTTGWAVGEYGFIWKTMDRGKNWIKIESGTTNDLNRIVFIDNGKTGFIFGNKNTLLRYDASQDRVEDKAISISPEKIELYQNYPNPFNGETNITYRMMSSASIVLKVFDVNGKEVVTLVEGFQSSGFHNVKWNGKDKTGKEVGSGIYLSSFKSGVFNRTVKICLNR